MRGKMYKWNAQDYRNSSSAQQKWARELMAKLNLKGSERILDIGCGDGKVTAELAAYVSQGAVLGIDSSAEMVDLARETHPPTRHANLSFRLSDARELDFRSEFDLVFSNAVLHWVIDHLPVLKGICKSLAPSGRILLQMGGKGNAAGVVDVLNVVMAGARWRRYSEGFSFPYGFYSPGDYRAWMAEAGLRPRRLELIPKDMVHKGKDGLSGWVRTTWLPYTQRVPEGLRGEFVNEILDRYIEHHPLDSGGFVHVRMVRLEVEAADDQASRVLMARAYERAGASKLAISTFREALNRSPDDLRVIIPAVAALYNAKEYEQAEQILTRASEQKLSHPLLSELQLQDHLRRGQLDQASGIGGAT